MGHSKYTWSETKKDALQYDTDEFDSEEETDMEADIDYDMLFGKYLMEAAAVGDVDRASRILKTFEYETECLNEIYNGTTVLCAAAAHGRRSIVKILIDHGADVNGEDDKEDTPLLVAVKAKHERTALLLYDKYDADAELTDKKGFDAFYYAARGGLAQLTRKFIDELKFDPEKPYGPDSDTPWHAAARHGRTEVMHAMLKHVPDLDVTSEDDESALDIAIKYGRLGVCATLLNLCRHADVNRHDMDDVTPLSKAIDAFFASPRGSARSDTALAIVKLLVSKGAEIDMKMGDGTSPLEKAAKMTTSATDGRLLDLLKKHSFAEGMGGRKRDLAVFEADVKM